MRLGRGGAGCGVLRGIERQSGCCTLGSNEAPACLQTVFWVTASPLVIAQPLKFEASDHTQPRGRNAPPARTPDTAPSLTFVVALVMPPHIALRASEGDSDLLLVAEPALGQGHYGVGHARSHQGFRLRASFIDLPDLLTTGSFPKVSRASCRKERGNGFGLIGSPSALKTATLRRPLFPGAKRPK